MSTAPPVELCPVLCLTDATKHGDVAQIATVKRTLIVIQVLKVRDLATRHHLPGGQVNYSDVGMSTRQWH